VYKIFVAMLQRLVIEVFGAVPFSRFAYNEVPTFAVANDCWFRARQNSTRPFFFTPTVLIQSLKCFR
jgi:hypothetical protein